LVMSLQDVKESGNTLGGNWSAARNTQVRLLHITLCQLNKCLTFHSTCQDDSKAEGVTSAKAVKRASKSRSQSTSLWLYQAGVDACCNEGAQLIIHNVFTSETHIQSAYS
jgi:hypothetical protein